MFPNLHQACENMAQADLTIIRRPQVEQRTGYSRNTIYRRITDGLLTRPVPLGAQCRGWPAREIDAINAARIAGKSDQEIRALVERLHAARKELQ